MSGSKQKQQAEKVKNFFAKNKNVNTLYITSDGNMFRAEHYANDWSLGLKDRTVTPASRGYTEGKAKVLAALGQDDQGGNADDDSASTDAGDQSTDTGDGSADEMKALVNEHIELFDTKPAYNISLDKLKAKIAAKKAELETGKNIDSDKGLNDDPTPDKAEDKGGNENDLSQSNK